MKKILLIISFNAYIFANNILIINSYSSTLKWTQQQSESIIKTLNQKKDMQIFVEFMNTKIFKPTKETEENFLKFYKNKYKNISFDTIITTDDNALNFIIKYKNDTLFKNAKIFFSGVNNLSLSTTLDTNIIGGDCTDGKNTGKIIALKVIKYLTGTPIEDIPFNFKEGNKVYLNVQNLIKFGIKVEDLSLRDPILINKQNSFYNLYQKWVNIFIAFILSSIIFMFILAKKNRALKKYSKKIKDLNDTLEFKVADALKELDKQHIKHKKNIIKNTKFSVIGQMAAGITHEINTPLTYIKGTIEMSRYDLENMPENKFKQQLLDDNQKVMEGIERMSIIVESMREMSQVTPNIRTVCNIYDTLITALRILYNRFKLISKIYINNELFTLKTSQKGKFKFMASIHKQRMEQVWSIIINNALDELVKVDNFDDRRVDIDISNKNGKIEVTIQDNAGGVPNEIKDKIFEPFVSTKESSGIGIGLNVAKKIINEHNVSIEVKNQNDGACFIISGFTSLPLSEKN
ncbi:MAG: HAMP domain-containing histidine kinase [Arcobacteraceae bacterium]|nr:HAMP domain-containing histidine kinase [Arcobacteraceae bacterium]